MATAVHRFTSSKRRFGRSTDHVLRIRQDLDLDTTGLATDGLDTASTTGTRTFGSLATGVAIVGSETTTLDPSPTNTPIATPTPTANGSALSPGVLYAIIGGGAVVGIIILSTIIYCCCCRKKRKEEKQWVNLEDSAKNRNISPRKDSFPSAEKWDSSRPDHYIPPQQSRIPLAPHDQSKTPGYDGTMAITTTSQDYTAEDPSSPKQRPATFNKANPNIPSNNKLAQPALVTTTGGLLSAAPRRPLRPSQVPEGAEEIAGQDENTWETRNTQRDTAYSVSVYGDKPEDENYASYPPGKSAVAFEGSPSRTRAYGRVDSQPLRELEDIAHSIEIQSSGNSSPLTSPRQTPHQGYRNSPLNERHYEQDEVRYKNTPNQEKFRIQSSHYSIHSHEGVVGDFSTIDVPAVPKVPVGLTLTRPDSTADSVNYGSTLYSPVSPATVDQFALESPRRPDHFTADSISTSNSVGDLNTSQVNLIRKVSVSSTGVGRKVSIKRDGHNSTIVPVNNRASVRTSGASYYHTEAERELYDQMGFDFGTPSQPTPRSSLQEQNAAVYDDPLRSPYSYQTDTDLDGAKYRSATESIYDMYQLPSELQGLPLNDERVSRHLSRLSEHQKQSFYKNQT